jgi:hypothetical protein
MNTQPPENELPIATSISQKMLDKLSLVEHAIQKVDLFAITFDSSRKLWDVLVASDWLDSSKAEGIRKVSKEMAKILTRSEMALFSRIAILPMNSPVLIALTSALEVAHEQIIVKNCMFNGLSFEELVVFHCVRPTVLESALEKRLAKSKTKARPRLVTRVKPKSRSKSHT